MTTEKIIGLSHVAPKGEDKYIYYAAPLFNPQERLSNVLNMQSLEDRGFKVFLPQLDAGQAAAGASRKYIFDHDVQALSGASAVVGVLNGRVPDEGTCVELGMAAAWNTPIIILNEDDRSFMQGHPNIMLEYLGPQCSTMIEVIEQLEYLREQGVL